MSEDSTGTSSLTASPELYEAATVLVVDDNPTNLGVLFRLLGDEGYRVLVATDGESALAQANQALPNLILLDIIMPGMDGFQTCRQFKANPATSHIPIIFMTALSDTDDKVKGFEAGAVDYITKPFHHDEVLARVQTHLTVCQLQCDMQCQNEQLAQLNAQLSQRNEELAVFSRAVAHDLKNPLNVMIGLADMLAEDSQDISSQELREVSLSITRSGRKMIGIIESLLILAGVRQQKAEMNPLDMNNIVSEALQRLGRVIEQTQADILYPQQWPPALGFPMWVEEVWVNYLSNAIKYGGTPPQVELGADTGTGDMVRFWIRDNGNGLTPEEQIRVFEPYTRLSQANVEGYGLGLSIVRHIVDKMGGETGVECTSDKGCEFYFTLPRANNLE